MIRMRKMSHEPRTVTPAYGRGFRGTAMRANWVRAGPGLAMNGPTACVRQWCRRHHREMLLAPMTERSSLGSRSPPRRRRARRVGGPHRRVNEQVLAPKQGVDRRPAETGGAWSRAGDRPRIGSRSLRDDAGMPSSGIAENRYREFTGGAATARESKQMFLPGPLGPGPVDPDVIPYYLCWCGQDQIPFEVQYQIAVQHAAPVHSTTSPVMRGTRPLVAARPGVPVLNSPDSFFAARNPTPGPALSPRIW